MILSGQQSEFKASLDSNSPKSFSKSDHRIPNDMISSQSLQIRKYKQQILAMFRVLQTFKGDKLFEATIYESLFVLQHRFSLWEISLLIDRLHCLVLNQQQQSTVRVIMRRIEANLSNLDQLNSQADLSPELTKPLSLYSKIASESATIFDKQGRANQTTHIDSNLMSQNSVQQTIHLDIETVLGFSKAIERLIENIRKVIAISSNFLLKMNTRSLSVVMIASNMQKIIKCKTTIAKLIKGLEKVSTPVSQSQYLLVYALYLDVICKDHY